MVATEPRSGSIAPDAFPTECIGRGAMSAETPPPGPLDIFAYLEPGERLGSLGRLGHYEILETLGRGGFGVVLKAFDEKLHRPVAIKALDPHLGATSPARKSFLREARSAAMVRHENAVHIYAVEERPVPYLVMEYIEGRTLQHRIDAHGPLPATEVVALGIQICEGLAAAHDRGLIHRDVKPANILLEGKTTLKVKLTDFGLARTADDASQSRSGAVVGTPLYMAPEQADGGTIDPRADLFSLGSVLYTMASGRAPFRAPTSLAVMNRVANDTPRDIRHIVPEVPAGLCAVIAKLQAKKPDDRYATAREAADALRHCLTQAAARKPRKWWWLAAMAFGVWALSVAVIAARSLSADTPEAAVAPRTEPIPPPSSETEAWERKVAALPTMDAQVAAVADRMVELNPTFAPVMLLPRIEEGRVVGVVLLSDHVTDLTPLRAFPALKHLSCRVLEKGRIRDLSGLRGLKLEKLYILNNPVGDLSPLEGMPLTELYTWNMTATDLSPLRGMPLVELNCGGSPVRDLTPLAGMPLKFLCVNCSPVSDLSPLRGMALTKILTENNHVADIGPLAGMPVEHLGVEGSRVTDLSVIRGMPLKILTMNEPSRHRDLIRELPQLELVNGKPKAEALGEKKTP